MSKRHALATLVSFAALAACGSETTLPTGGTAAPTAAATTSPVAFERLAFPGFRHDSGYAGSYYFPETFGSGVALFDLEGDGDLDLYAVQGGTVPGSAEDEARLATGGLRAPNALFLNDGSGAFVDASDHGGDATIGEAGRRFGMGVSVGDVNGDGLEDLFLTNVGRDGLLVATGDTASLFRDATPAALHAGPSGEAWTTASGMADVNRDGHLDLVVVGYTEWSAASDPDCRSEAGLDYCDVNVYAGIEDRLFLGDGAGGFEEVSEAWGFGRVPGRGLGVCLADLDGDGFVDAYVANDTEANRTYLNQGGSSFQDRTAASGASSNMDGAFEAGMGVALGDVSDDGLADVVVTNFSSESNNLYVNLGRGRFRERSRPAGIAAASIPKLAFGVTLMDFDLDGREDLYTACGHVLRHIEAQVATWAWRQADQLLLATGPTRFREVELGALLGAERVGRGVAGGDLDGDGRPDLAVTHSGDELILARTTSTDPELSPHWLTLEVRQAPREGRSNTTAVGARVELELASGRRLVRWVRSGTSYLSQDDRRSHFGIPAGEAPVAAHITWPDGTTSRHGLADAPLGRIHRIERP
ncbi:MAG: CRTAC1 family protein [Planctomycetota bacterium]|nr:CRTAC1 family protein [Planctomycetota bacterium]